MSIIDRFRVDAFMEPEGIVAVSDARGPAGPLMVIEQAPDGYMRRRYVNARPLRATDPLFVRLVLTRREVAAGTLLPPWYFALGYIDPWRGVGGEAVFFFVPVALLVRALRWAEFVWNRARCRPSWFDKQLVEARWGRRT